MAWLTWNPYGRSQLLTDGKSSARWYVQREDVYVWEAKIKAAAKQEGMDIEMWTLESDGFVYFLMTEGGDGVLPALSVEAMSIILRRRNLKPQKTNANVG